MSAAALCLQCWIPRGLSGFDCKWEKEQGRTSLVWAIDVFFFFWKILREAFKTGDFHSHQDSQIKHSTFTLHNFYFQKHPLDLFLFWLCCLEDMQVWSKANRLMFPTLLFMAAGVFGRTIIVSRWNLWEDWKKWREVTDRADVFYVQRCNCFHFLFDIRNCNTTSSLLKNIRESIDVFC